MAASGESLNGRAAENLRQLEKNPYPGRGIVLGRSADGARFCQLYWIMGRSGNSRNRFFLVEAERLRTKPLEPERMEHPELVIYTAMARHRHHHIVTNGDHTDTVLEALGRGEDYRAALRGRSHEPDAPHYTPRIAGGILADGKAWLAILKADPADPARSIRSCHEYEALPPGFGWCLTTYRGDGDPLPSFEGEPRLLPLAEEGEALLEEFWRRLDERNRVALALKTWEAGSEKASIRVVNAREPA